MATCRIVIEMEIEGEYEDAYAVIDALLDNGIPQDEINNHENEDAGPLKVLSASVKPG